MGRCAQAAGGKALSLPMQHLSRSGQGERSNDSGTFGVPKIRVCLRRSWGPPFQENPKEVGNLHVCVRGRFLWPLAQIHVWRLQRKSPRHEMQLHQWFMRKGPEGFLKAFPGAYVILWRFQAQGRINCNKTRGLPATTYLFIGTSVTATTTAMVHRTGNDDNTHHDYHHIPCCDLPPGHGSPCRCTAR